MISLVNTKLSTITINIIDKNIEIRVKLLSKIASADVIENPLDGLKG